MERANSIIWLVIVTFVAGCGSTKVEPGMYSFGFEFAEGEYEIIGKVSSSATGSNYLVRRDGKKLVLYAEDSNQNGTLDTLIVGTATLAQANEIYGFGISLARERGRYRSQEVVRTFAFSQTGLRFTVQSIMLDTDMWYNRFVIFDEVLLTERVMIDTDADGVLDSVVDDGGDLKKGQDSYTIVLEEGVRAQRIKLENGRFQVSTATRENSRPL